MRAFIDSVDGRKTTFYDRLKPQKKLYMKF